MQIHLGKEEAHQCSRGIDKATLQMSLDELEIVPWYSKIGVAKPCMGYFFIN